MLKVKPEGNCTGYIPNCSGGGLSPGMGETVYGRETGGPICPPNVATAFSGNIGPALQPLSLAVFCMEQTELLCFYN
ncbi:hypothetical protein T4E_12023 [Trichinella pseudospiralis]|uniref:Uncharacterized protein n=1 Tax=Trichinella pseudospiralis TaxID=6337 RepID=A0A0V0XTQ0_TRIPS|nr:hypothetical protein T4E_12023 [Trichinella pseudospiralis]